MKQTILDKIKRGSPGLPNRIVIAGPMGIGKTTLASKSPEPLFVCAEDGLTGFDHLERYTVDKLPELHELLDGLPSTKYKTVVIDTSDFLERIIARHLMENSRVSSIEEVGGGYGKGFTAIEEQMVAILSKLDHLRTNGIGSIILSHTHIKPYTTPDGVTYDRYELKGVKKSVGLLGEWADLVAFCTYEVFKTKKEGEKKEVAIGGERVMRCTWTPAWDAKNRLNLPDSVPMDWDALQAAIKDNSGATLKAKVKALFDSAKWQNGDKAKWEPFIAALDSKDGASLKLAIERLEKRQ